jgi:hypothetical protein
MRPQEARKCAYAMPRAWTQNRSGGPLRQRFLDMIALLGIYVPQTRQLLRKLSGAPASGARVSRSNTVHNNQLRWLDFRGALHVRRFLMTKAGYTTSRQPCGVFRDSAGNRQLVEGRRSNHRWHVSSALDSRGLLLRSRSLTGGL